MCMCMFTGVIWMLFHSTYIYTVVCIGVDASVQRPESWRDLCGVLSQQAGPVHQKYPEKLQIRLGKATGRIEIF